MRACAVLRGDPGFKRLFAFGREVEAERQHMQRDSQAAEVALQALKIRLIQRQLHMAIEPPQTRALPQREQQPRRDHEGAEQGRVRDHPLLPFGKMDHALGGRWRGRIAYPAAQRFDLRERPRCRAKQPLHRSEDAVEQLMHAGRRQERALPAHLIFIGQPRRPQRCERAQGHHRRAEIQPQQPLRMPRLAADLPPVALEAQRHLAQTATRGRHARAQLAAPAAHGLGS